MTKDTKHKIMDAALTLFSEKGYDAVSVGEIAQAVGIKAPSLYKHYKSKQDIFSAIMDEMETRYHAQASSMRLDGAQAEKDLALYADISEQQLTEMGQGLFLYFLHDAYTRRFRKMLRLEQYHNAELAALYAKQYGDDPLSYQGMLFGMLAKMGVFSDEDPQMMALHFYAPLHLLLDLCDCQPHREPQALQTLQTHIRQFRRLYLKKEG